MAKVDLAKEDKAYFTAKTKPAEYELGPVRYLAVKGKGDPSSESFATKISALYATAYTVKFDCKALGKDFVVPKLEGQWWYDERRFGTPSMEEAPKAIPRSEWEYRLLIRMPEFVTEAQVSAAASVVVQKKGIAEAALVSLLKLNEGRVVQMLHVGPFNKEPETLAHMMAFMREKGLQKNGLHHEIYLSDFRKTAPEKLRTILREPVK